MRGAWLLFAALPACQVIGSFEDFKGGAGQGGSAGQAGAGQAGAGQAGQSGEAGEAGEAGAAGSAVDCGTPPQTKDGKEMVGVARKDKSKCFWIDKAEVTRGEYTGFLSSGERPKTDLAHCDTGAKPSLQLDSDCTDKLPDDLDPGSASLLPRTCVDWCGAYLYCLWAGKTLCGGPEDAPKDLSTSLWYAACTGDGASQYSYGDVYEEGKCNVSKDSCATGSCLLQPASSFPSCKTRDGVLAMNGNAAEWTAECGSFSPQKDCNIRGGSVSTNSTETKCESTTSKLPNAVDPFVGFRCCVAP